MRKMHKTIKDYIYENLNPNEQQTALEFVVFLEENGMTFYKDNGECWKSKIYYWVKINDECVCFIAIKDPDEANNHWTVWSDDLSSKCLNSIEVEDDIKEAAWKYADRCGHCGSCSGGRKKIIFGREFSDICGCTFRIDNPSSSDLKFLKHMVHMRINEIKKQPEK